MKTKIFLFLTLLLFTAGASATISVTALRTEGLNNPLGIDTEQPRFSWKLEASTERDVMQKSYQIIVASSEKNLAQNNGDVWNSGKISSEASLWISYCGSTLKSNAPYYWKVKVWTNKGETEWSSAAHWSMGLLSQNDWKAQWIGLDKAMPWDSETTWSRLSARYLRKEFSATKTIKRATAHISGLGLYELFINGKRIGNQVLAPAPTDYRKTVLYNTYDVTSALKQGNNAVGVTLGNGRFYTMRQNYKPYKITNFGYPKLYFNLTIEYSDGTSEVVGSNASWKLTADGPIRSNNEYDGEEYDARKELTGWNEAGYDDSKWMAAERVSIPSGTLQAQMMPGMKVVDKLMPVSIKPLGQKFIIDLGQNMAGWLRMHVHGNKSDSVTLRFAETLQKSGELYTENLRDAHATDIYILKGETAGEDWSPRFVYHGFRYVEVSGLKYAPVVSDFVGEVVNDEMENLGSFTSSNDVLNQVLKNAWWGIRSNYKGMPVDCPQRNERQPWLGDRSMGCWGESFMFDNNALYAKWGNDIREAQREDGCLPDVAPAYWNYFSDNVTWPSTLPMLCDMTYTQFGNKKPIEDNYATIKKWLNHIRKEYMTAEYIVTRDEYGDWCVPPESLELIHSRDPKRQTDGALISTAYYYKMLQLMTRFANVQGLKNDAVEFSSLAQKISDGFNKKFFRTDSLFYGNNTATSNLLPLAFGMVPKQYLDTVCKQIIKTVVAGNTPQITTGMIGTQWLMRELSKMGRADVAFALATNDKYPSWGYMAANGATTIWELWNGNTASPKMNSGNHVMLLGDLIPWAYENLAGIKSSYESAAFKHIILKPNFEIPDLETIDASYITPYGKVVSKWKKTLMHLDWEVSIPANTTAEVHLPNGKIQNIGSGNYTFSVELPQKKGIVTNEFLYEKADFPQCHSATIAEATNGDLVTAFFGGTREGHPDVCIYVCRKEKGSNKWTKPALAADGILSPTLRKACYNPVLYQQPNGAFYLFYKIGNKVSDWTGYLRTSDDGGKTWGKAQQLPEGYLGPIKNKIVDVDGKSIAPSSTEGDGWKVHFEIAEEGGRKIHKVGPIAASEVIPTQLQGNASTDIEGGDNNVKNVVQAIQPSILVHKDGRLQILCRTRNGKIATAWSSDKGETWTPLTLTSLPNNNSGTDAVTLQDGRFALIYNAVETPKGEKKGPRTPLNIAVSKDGINWEMKMVLEDSPISQYSYPSIIQGKDGRIHVVYTWRRQRVKYMEVKL
ncbi:MAG: family 78 glycoside hydrolase catalytic domain [Paludibacter sp.]